MAEIRYAVAVTFPNNALAGDWLAWLRAGHVAAVIQGGAVSAEVVKLAGVPESYEVVYRFRSRGDFDIYDREIAPALREEGLKLFPIEKGITYRRQVAEVSDRFP